MHTRGPAQPTPNAQHLSPAPSAQPPAPTTRPVLAGLLAGLVGHLGYSLTDAVTLGAKPGYLLWMVFAGIVVAAAEARSRRHAGEHP